jgi:hypothetical protein
VFTTFLFRILFRTQDLSELREYLYLQFTKILTGDVSISDFIIATVSNQYPSALFTDINGNKMKEVKLGGYKSEIRKRLPRN